MGRGTISIAAVVATTWTLTTSCSSADSLTVIGSPIAERSVTNESLKTPLTSINKSLLLTESEFPSIPNGEFVSYWQDLEGGQPQDDCIQTGKGEGGAANLSNDQQMILSSVSLLDTPFSVETAARCIDSDQTIIDVPELPDDVLVISTEPSEYWTAWLDGFAFVRGVWIAIKVTDEFRSLDSVKSDLVTVFKRQVDKINAA